MTTGLYIFIGVLHTNVAGLLLDAVLYLLFGYDHTITNLVRTSQPWIGVAILCLQLIGTAGLACHFYPSIT